MDTNRNQLENKPSEIPAEPNEIQQPPGEPEQTPPRNDSERSSTQPSPVSENTLDSLAETQNMEVHHHGHIHHEKKWKEYLFSVYHVISCCVQRLFS